MTGLSPLDRLAKAYDIEPDYVDIWQRHHVIGDETKRALLDAMGVAASDDAETAASLDAALSAPFIDPLPNVVVRREGEVIGLPIALDGEATGRLTWILKTEAGVEIAGEASLDGLEIVERITLDGTIRVRRSLPLTPDLPLGYHRCTFQAGDTSLGAVDIIVTPKQAYWPASLKRPGGSIGVTAPLYGLRSARNAGIGDLADLAALAETLAPLGADFLGINPLHALFPKQPARFSPYAPSSRTALNVLAIAVDQVPEWPLSATARTHLEGTAGAARLEALHQQELIDYPAVTALKLEILEALFETFQSLPTTSERKVAFDTFVGAGGERLARHARFEALAEHFQGQDAGLTDWHDWPAGYRDPEDEAVQAFASTHEGRVQFYAYLQWLADQQLRDAQARAKAAGMALGLYLDLAVGVASDGAEAWANQGLLIDDVRIGAPPDDFNPDGQNWGLLPLSPHALKARGYRPFIEMLRATMRHAGALRIDHVLGLGRGFWLPEEAGVPGAYIRYPLDDLLGLVALESHRHGCVVIGEDLGTVPADFRDALDAVGLLGCRLLYFEREDDSAFRPASAYPKACITSVGTHDLPLLRGFWQGRDIDWREKLGLYADPAGPDRDREERRGGRAALLRLLASEQLLPDGVDPAAPPDEMPCWLVDACHRFLGRTDAALKAVQLEDAVGAIEQANLPGTVDAYPNWRRKIGVALEDLGDLPDLADLLRAVGATAKD